MCGQQKQSNDPRNIQHNPQYANYWAPRTRKRRILPHPAQPQPTNYWAPRARQRHQREHRPQRPTESSDPTRHARGRTGDCPGPQTNNNQTECHTGGGRATRLRRLESGRSGSHDNSHKHYGSTNTNGNTSSSSSSDGSRDNNRDHVECNGLCLRFHCGGGGGPSPPTFLAVEENEVLYWGPLLRPFLDPNSAPSDPPRRR